MDYFLHYLGFPAGLVTPEALGYAFIGGLLPSLIWLYFLLKEDASHPEPKSMILLAFVAGMLAVPVAIQLEKYIGLTLGGPLLSSGGPNLSLFTAWALVEEMLKYVFAAVLIFWRPIVDEAPDYVIYMLTVALGFAAAENMYFLIVPFSAGDVALGVFTGNIRFLGANLLHVFASAAIGFAIAFSDKSRPAFRMLAGAFGLILAVTLHTLFNTLIITEGTSTIFAAAFLVWSAAVVFFAAFEVLKYFQYRDFPTNTFPS